MAQERKTFNVEQFRLSVNDRIARAKTVDERKALCYLLGDVLMEANRYRGFMYIDGYKDVEDYQHRYY